MKDPLFTGVCTALVTPFCKGKIDFDMVRKLLQHQIDNGVTAVVLAGTTGEAPTLSDDEKTELFSFSKNFVGNQCTIIAGTGSNSTDHAVKLSQMAEQTGVDGLLVVSPYYNKANPEGIFRHYKTIAESVSIPIVMYNVPSRTGTDIPVSIYKRLSAIQNINGIKEASTDIVKQLRTHTHCGGELFVWSGNDDQIIPSISLGGYGVISVLSNLYPAQTVDMVNAALSGDFEKANILQSWLLPYIDLLFSDVNPIPVKYAMKVIGFDCGDCRLPLCEPSEEIQRNIINMCKR
jgi:4-hydroxy-tetrahydrodipicolinate synthase